MAKMGKGDEVRLGVLGKICCVFNCQLDDIIDFSL